MNEHRYPQHALHVAAGRGYDHDAHMDALTSGNEDAISLTHPYNWLNEAEVEAILQNEDPQGQPERTDELDDVDRIVIALDRLHGDLWSLIADVGRIATALERGIGIHNSNEDFGSIRISDTTR